ncbi:MAG: hypothetical protein QXU82_02630 [Candidatus Aenigmatarchaeota archaeon]
MAFDIFRKKPKEPAEPEEVELPPELEHLRLAGPPFPGKAEPARTGLAPEAPQRRPFVPEEFAEERFGPAPDKPKESEDRIAIILSKLDIIESRLKIIEEKLKK